MIRALAIGREKYNFTWSANNVLRYGDCIILILINYILDRVTICLSRKLTQFHCHWFIGSFVIATVYGFWDSYLYVHFSSYCTFSNFISRLVPCHSNVGFDRPKMQGFFFILSLIFCNSTPVLFPSYSFVTEFTAAVLSAIILIGLVL